MKPCKPLLSHLSRIEGQIKSLKLKMEADHSCEDIIQHALSASKSFDSFKAKILEEYINQELIKGKTLSQAKAEELQSVLKLAK